MTIDVDKTLYLTKRVQDELVTLQKRRFMGPRRIMQLCLFLVELLLHLRDLSDGLLMLAKQINQPPKPQQVEEPKKEEPDHEG